MAFQDQVEDLTSLSVSDTGELTQFLTDGVKDVTNRWLIVRPQDAEEFQRESAVIDTNSGLDLNGAKIISVTREAGADGSSDNSAAWEVCRKVPASMQSRVIDTESLHYASIYNPVYLIDDDNKVNVYPVPSGNNGYRVFYVNNVPTESAPGSTVIDYASTAIAYFPADKEYLVIMYAGIRLLYSTMSSNVISITVVPPDAPSLSTVSFSAPTAPTTPSDPSFTVTTISEDTVSAGSVSSITVGTSTAVATVVIAGPTIHSNTVPSYADQSLPASQGTFNTFFESGSLNPLDDGDPGALSITAVPPDTPDTPELTEIGAAPEYDNTIASSEFGDLATLIDTDEDVELATAKIQEINALIQNELNEFNEANILFQATIQKEVQEDTLTIQKYQADLGVYQAEVGAQVQEYTQKLQRYNAELTTVYQAWAKTESDNLQLFQIEIQNEQNNFNEANAVYQAALKEEAQNLQVAAGRVQQQAQIEIQEVLKQADVDMADAQKEADLNLQASIQNVANDLKAKIENNAKTLEKDIQEYAQELTLFSGEVQKYQSEIQSGIQTMQGTIADNQALIAKYQADTAEYTAEITAQTQEQTVKMQHYQLLYSQLKAEYDQAFMIAAPEPQPQQ